MKLVNLEVQELYGYFRYVVKFNSDVTFIYGANGCGKTTILNITEAIITGQLYKLFNYTFKKIILKYAPNAHPESVDCIDITYEKPNLKVIFKSEEYLVSKIAVHNVPQDSPRNLRELYFSAYNFLKDIRYTFNYVYLPLNRSTTVYDTSNSESFAIRRSLYIEENSETIAFRSKDKAMSRIEELIRLRSNRANSEITKINDNFRNNILKSLLEIDRSCNFTELFQNIIRDKNSISTLQKIKKSYIKMLKDLEIISVDEEIRYSQFFDSVIEEIKNQAKAKSNGIPIELLLKYQEISKIEELVKLAEDLEYQKTKIRRPIKVFLETMNDFIGDDTDEKELKIDSVGKVYFTTKYTNNPISIHALSSGEKQLLTFFANLIFNVRDKSSGIFVVDEPELSLHLSWQKIFVERAMEINGNIQLIFATHAPEIIGKRRDKMYKLEKQYTKGD